jgi:adenine/guanine/hypoxanthine permease
MESPLVVPNADSTPSFVPPALTPLARMGFVENLNDKVAASAVGRWFRLDDGVHPRRRVGSRFTVRQFLSAPCSSDLFCDSQTELRAGLTTFAAMAYIISVNAAVGSSCYLRFLP